ncbi:MAG: hypothetical protein JWO13_3020 [Acidobacteriales bacterium]|nr:hypothetical protein [Terriglobales bacterium]
MWQSGPMFPLTPVQVKSAPVLPQVVVLLALAIPIGVPTGALAQNPDDGTQLHAAMPLGGDSIILQPAKRRLNMLATVECKDFENIKLVGTGGTKKVLDTDGNPVKQYPPELGVRFTVGSRTVSQEPTPNTVEATTDVDHFQSNLQFRLKVFHGIHATVLEPTEMKMIGIPADIPADERIYHLTFKLPDVPVEDRIMFEVLDENGTRVAKFHLQLM